MKSPESTWFHLVSGQIKFALVTQQLCFMLLHSRDTVFICKLDLLSHLIAKLKNQSYIDFRRSVWCTHTTGLQPEEQKSCSLVLNGTIYNLPSQTSKSTKLHTFLKNLCITFIKFKIAVTQPPKQIYIYRPSISQCSHRKC